MKVAAIQFKPRRGDPSGSLRQLVKLARKAAADADLVVLPEMVTGYAFDDPGEVRSIAEHPKGRTFAALAPIARDHECWIIAGFAEVAGERLFNSAMVIRPDGELDGVYRKTLLFDADLPWAQPGGGDYPLFEIDGVLCTVGICMDLNDNRFTRWCALERVDVVALPTCWVEETDPVWPFWQRRMLGLNATLVAADQWGEDGSMTYAGRSAILSAREIVAGASAEGDAIVVADLQS